MEEEDFVATTKHLDEDELVFSEDSEENETEDDPLGTPEAKTS